MGIYPNGIIYGIKIYKLIDNESYTLFERQYKDAMDYNSRKEANIFYENLPQINKDSIRFLIYTECSSPSEDDFMMWYPISLDVFSKEFSP